MRGGKVSEKHCVLSHNAYRNCRGYKTGPTSQVQNIANGLVLRQKGLVEFEGCRQGFQKACRRGLGPGIKGVKFAGFFINRLNLFIIIIYMKLSMKALRSLPDTCFVIPHYGKLLL